MTDGDKKMTLPNLEGEPAPSDLKQPQSLPGDGESVGRSAADLEAVFDVPVQVSGAGAFTDGRRSVAQAWPRYGARA